MKRFRATLAAVSVAVLALSIQGRAQDPRSTLKPGYKDAGQVARNLELVATMPKAPGFFDPKTPAGAPLPAPKPPSATAPPAPAPGTPPPPPPATSAIDFANSDIAFRKADMFLGNFNGFNT